MTKKYLRFLDQKHINAGLWHRLGAELVIIQLKNKLVYPLVDKYVTT